MDGVGEVGGCALGRAAVDRVSGAAGGGLLCCDALGDGVDLVGGEAFEEFEVLVVGEAVFAGGAFDGECLLGGFGAFGCGLGDLVALLVIGELGEAGFLGCLLLRLLDSGEFLLDCLAGFAFGDERLLRAGVGVVRGGRRVRCVGGGLGRHVRGRLVGGGVGGVLVGHVSPWGCAASRCVVAARHHAIAAEAWGATSLRVVRAWACV
ncbi:hypothetical protein GS438_18960 [Rhodococcus hoagii]|nr:hypothetical protein [Prescottella equi]